jgi:hypothetical protein
MFCYTSWRFYAFSGTNLLTRCHSASSLFSAIFVFQKSYTGNILRIGRNKSWTSRNILFLPKLREDRRWDGGGPGASHTMGWRGPAPGRATRWWGHLAHLQTLPFRLYIPLDRKNLKDVSFFLETYCKPPPSSKRDWEDPRALPGTLPERGILAGGLLHHHGRLRSDVWVVYLGLRVHSIFRSCEVPYMIKIIFV